MKKILFIAALLSPFTFNFSPCLSQQPDAIFKLLHYEWTVNTDGTSDYHYRHEVQILRNRTLTAYADLGETFVVYNPDLEELTVNEVYTVRKTAAAWRCPKMPSFISCRRSVLTVDALTTCVSWPWCIPVWNWAVLLWSITPYTVAMTS